MSVILTLGDVIYTQGYSASNVSGTLINSGTENVKNVGLKVTDSVIFSVLWPDAISSPTSALNEFSAFLKNRTNSNYLFPAGTTKVIQWKLLTVKASAPVQVHNLTSDYTYEVY